MQKQTKTTQIISNTQTNPQKQPQVKRAEIEEELVQTNELQNREKCTRNLFERINSRKKGAPDEASLITEHCSVNSRIREWKKTFCSEIWYNHVL